MALMVAARRDPLKCECDESPIVDLLGPTLHIVLDGHSQVVVGEALNKRARHQDRDSVGGPAVGSGIAGTAVMPPSTSYVPTLDPASGSVTTAAEVARWSAVPFQLVACAAARSHSPVVAVSVPDGLAVRPVEVPRSSSKMTSPPWPVPGELLGDEALQRVEPTTVGIGREHLERVREDALIRQHPVDADPGGDVELMLGRIQITRLFHGLGDRESTPYSSVNIRSR